MYGYEIPAGYSEFSCFSETQQTHGILSVSGGFTTRGVQT